MAKDNQSKAKKKKFIEKRKRADNTVEFVVTESPSRTWWGKAIVILIVFGTIGIPVLALIIAMLGK